MNRTEFYNEHEAILKDAQFMFTVYYKHVFSFEANVDQYKITAEVGGNANDIYRTEVTANSPKSFNEIEPFSCTIYKNSSIVASFYDY